MRSVVVELVSRATLPGIPLFCCIHLLVVCSIPLDGGGGGGGHFGLLDYHVYANRM